MILKKVLLILTITSTFVAFAQRGQRVGYVDMNYILENVPEYVEAQSRLDAKVVKWNQKLGELSNEIEALETTLANEKILLTKELIVEREEDIYIKNQELQRLQIAYFGPKGDLFQLRKQFATPVQDQVYNAIQEIVARKKYDFVINKSSDLILLYSNPKYDISEMVLNSIVKGRKKKAVADKKSKRFAKASTTTSAATKFDNDDTGESNTLETSTEEAVETEYAKKDTRSDAQKRIDKRNADRAALKARIAAQHEAKVRRKDSLKAVSDAKRAAILKDIEDQKEE